MTCYDLDAGKATINVTAEDIRVKVSGNDLSNGYLSEKIVAGTNVTVTELNDGGVETLEISASSGSGVFTPTINGTNMVEVSQESDFGTLVGNTRTLAANTTYFIRGDVTCVKLLAITNSGISIIGWDRDKDGLSYTGVAGLGDFITITDVNFELANIKLSSINSTPLDVVLRASNFSYGAYNDGRDKVITIINCQFRNCFDVWHIEGFDLVDIQQTLVWYIQATGMGCHFKNTSKLQISSCEYVRWFDETSIPTPSGYATTSMVEIVANGVGNGNGATNISGSIFHPQQTQNGIDIVTGSTTGFGTITGNTFVNVGLTTGETFLGDSLTPALGAYSQTECLKFDILANNGILNSTSGVVMTANSNAVDTALSTGVPAVINTGTLAILRAAVRYDITTGGRATYTATKEVYVSIHGTISYQKQGGGTDAYVFYVYKNGVLLAGSDVEVTSGGATADGVASINYGNLMNQNDYIEIYVENPASGDDILIKDLQLVIRE